MRAKDMIEVLFEESNLAIVKLAERAYPGVVIQGDSLANFFVLIDELRGLIGHDNDEAKELVDELYQLIKYRIDKYESVLKQNNIALPYVRQK